MHIFTPTNYLNLAESGMNPSEMRHRRPTGKGNADQGTQTGQQSSGKQRKSHSDLYVSDAVAQAMREGVTQKQLEMAHKDMLHRRLVEEARLARHRESKMNKDEWSALLVIIGVVVFVFGAAYLIFRYYPVLRPPGESNTQYAQAQRAFKDAMASLVRL